MNLFAHSLGLKPKAKDLVKQTFLEDKSWKGQNSATNSFESSILQGQ